MARTFLTPILLPADPVAPLEAATRQFADEVFVGDVDPYIAEPTGRWELWIYEAPPPPAPVIAQPVPWQAPAGSPTLVTISVSNGAALPTTTVHLEGGPAAPSAVCIDASTMQFTWDGPEAQGAIVDITCANDASVSNAVQLTVIAPLTPIMTSVTPNVLTPAGGQVTIIGSQFVDPCMVWFKNSVQITPTFVSSTELSAVLPADAAGPAKAVMVQNVAGNTFSNVVNVDYA